MDYKLKIGQETYAVQAEPVDETGTGVITTGEESHRVTISAISTNHLNIQLDGRLHNLFVAPTDQGTWVWVDGRARLVQDADKLERRRSSGPAETPGAVTPPTPASVVRVMVEVGETVEKGRPLVVVSAMKMELTLSAPYAGTVTAVNTEEGAQVSPGEILVDIEERREGSENE